MNLKFSIITVVKNGMPFLEDCLTSILNQKYLNKEIIIIASKSNDGTENYLKKNKKKISKLIINCPLNLYESINKAIKMATGDYIFILHADDIFFDKYVLKNVQKFIEKNKYDIIFGNITYVLRNNISKISRNWLSSEKKNYLEAIRKGWTPPHTSMFVKKKIYEKYLYNTKYKISSDYDFIARTFIEKKITKKYFDCFMCIMRTGGVSDSGYKNFFVKLIEDFNIIKKNKIQNQAIIIKRLYKIWQFFPKIFPIKNRFKITQNILNQNKILITKNTKILKKRNGFIFSALNLAFLGFIDKIKPNRYYVLWPDGIGSKLVNLKIKKTPGRDLVVPLLKNLKYSSIKIIGNYDQKIFFFFQKYCKNIKFFNIPFGNFDYIKKKLQGFKFCKNELLFINIPTPKQEMVANYLLSKNHNSKIVCIGGGLNMLTGIEKSVPFFLDKIGLEALWRLRNDTLRRLLRIFLSFFGVFYNFFLIRHISNNLKIRKS